MWQVPDMGSSPLSGSILVKFLPLFRLKLRTTYRDMHESSEHIMTQTISQSRFILFTALHGFHNCITERGWHRQITAMSTMCWKWRFGMACSRTLFFSRNFFGDILFPFNTFEDTSQSAMVYLKFFYWNRDFSSSNCNFLHSICMWLSKYSLNSTDY